MNCTKALLANKASVLLLALGGIFLGDLSGSAQGVQHQIILQPGGMPGAPVMTGITRATNGMHVTWDGPAGYYQLFQEFNVAKAKWQPVGGPTNLSRTATVAPVSSNAFFRVSGPAGQYAGDHAVPNLPTEVCAECHAPIQQTQTQTAHPTAFDALKEVHQETNASCLPCHTVGYGVPSGFISEAATPQLVGVQCENCHGPAANHAANEIDPIVRPRVDLAATVCGGCHNATSPPATAAVFHPPFYEDWNSSAHRAVLPELQQDFAGSLGPTVFIPTCGRCHSGTVREALLEKDPLPNGQEAGAVGIACAVCHDPHSVHVHTNVLNGVVTNLATGVVVDNEELGAVYTNQLRNPFASLQDYHTAGNFATNYNAEINVCGQCHNDRGASLATTDRAPHHSPQYNMLLGTFSQQDTGVPSNQPATHSRLEMQCVTCHMQTADFVSSNQPAVSGHKFVVDRYEACAECHGSAVIASNFVALVSAPFMSNQIQVVKGLLNAWTTTPSGTNVALAALKQKYQTLAWEYTNPGSLSSGSPGPNSTEQKLIPVNIQKARFNLYLVNNDGSYGTHNFLYCIDLLDAALNYVQAELTAAQNR